VRCGVTYRYGRARRLALLIDDLRDSIDRRLEELGHIRAGNIVRRLEE